MCESCWALIAKADDDEFLDSLELTHAERKVLEELYKQGEDKINEILGLQGQALKEAIEELSEEALGDIGELTKVLIALHTTDVFANLFEQAVQEAFEPLFHLAGETELAALDKEKVWNTSNKAAGRFVKRLKKLVPDMNESSTDVLLNSFGKAIEEGKTPAERALLVQEVSKTAAEGEEGPFSMKRAVRISRTMSTAAANGGKVEGWKQSEVVKGKKWRSAGGNRTRKTHKKANGQVKPLDEPFEVGNSKLMYPGDPSGEAKEIANCRCTMQSVLD
ncbi:phage minor head protein [Paenibacillus macerans]|uniref:phage minor head protein n=1 Tax=Paenibacillus macerans TaxID=44252 RepID=UPI00203F885D|nr:phage minor head protein [Paenibacillus macerans]MCM3699202.1 phage minor head protein [Paenibacillus macerans]